MSFQLVDQITCIRPGERAEGIHRPSFPTEVLPLGLLVEAVGQLASWTAMPQLKFDYRPVAASAGLVEVFRVPRAGMPIEIEVKVTSIRHQAISYQGSANCDGEVCLTLQRAIGPLLPIEEFDDKARIENLYELLCGAGIPPRPPVVPEDYEPEITCQPVIAGEGFSASFRLPSESAIYADHFPRQPVFPATLLLQTQIDATRRAYAARADGSLPEIIKVSGVKIRAFSGPGEELDFRVKELDGADGELAFRLETWRGDTRVSAASLYLRK
ncbi:MAG: hypothetical protein P8K76_04975 [Candidatus Binatia bacterium]|nr:hypothetical protein [Candidatus Binatia bacterium]MDG1958580.1 hypothetical protein [Candidatus Binatia bacterium]MDG2009111.1 hypothetical protein [Candidatus Binatia bacterium]